MRCPILPASTAGLRRARSLPRLGSILFYVSIVCQAQPWTGIVNPTRVADWTTSGVVGGIPSAGWANCATTACNTVYGGSVTAATIGAAISSAPANTVVRIPAGTFTLSSGLSITQSNVVLRGAGAASTKLVISGVVTGGGLGFNRAMNLMSGASGVGHGPNDGFTAPSHVASWTGGYSQGTTVITLSTTAGLVAGPVGTGSLIMLDQLDDPSDGWPAAGDIYSCASTTNNCSNQGGNNYAQVGRAEVQVVTVTGISGNNVTITPGVAYPNIRSGQSPQAYWNNGSPVSNSGIENLTVDYTQGGGAGLYILNAANVWITGTRWINTASGTGESYHIFVLQSAHGQVESNYFYGRPGDSCSNFPLANYVYSDQQVSDFVVDNNIIHTNVDAIIPNDPAGRNVFGYNYVDNGYIGVAGSQMHSGNVMMDLWEGNNMESFMGDVTHGSHHFITLFRNHFDGTAHNNSCSTGFAIGLLTNNRFFNVIGNVAGSSSYSKYEATLDNNNASTVFNLGWNGNNSGTPVTTDPNVKRTLLRWGNWDQFTSSNPTGATDATGVRWCGNSSDPGWTTTCASSSEVPSAITNFSSAVPASTTLPASFYMTAMPSWWATAFGTPPWPAIGPDVSNGSAPNTASAPTGGHANKIPARLCFENTSSDPGYSTSPPVKLFDAGACYSGGSLGQGSSSTAPPTSVSCTVH